MGTACLETEDCDRASSALRASPPSQGPPDEDVISLLAIKSAIRGLRSDHPLRIVLMGEPDEMTRAEYASKLMGWVRLAYCAKD